MERKNVTYCKFLRADPVVVWKLDIKLNIQVSLLKRISVLWHALSSHHPDGAWKRCNVFLAYCLTFSVLIDSVCFPSQSLKTKDVAERYLAQ